MPEIELLGQAVREVGRPIVYLMLIYLILKTPVASSLMLKMANGHEKDGSSRNEQSGQASIEFWKDANRTIVSSLVDDHNDESIQRQHEVMMLLREMKADNLRGVELIRDRLHAMSTPLTIAIADISRRRD